MTPEAARVPLQVALIGYGLGGRAFHAPFIATTPGLALAAVMTSDAAKAQAIIERYPGTRVVADVDAILALAPTLDLIAISTPNATHESLAHAALDAGCHVVVDKPFAVTATGARAIASHASSAGRLAIPFQNRRWDGDFLTLQRLLLEGALGDVHRFESRFDRWRPVPKTGWCRPDAHESAEDIVHDLGAHLVDQALQLFGPVATVFAEFTALHPEVVTVDDAFLALTHVSGVQSHLHMTTMAGVAAPRMSVYGLRATFQKYGLDVQEDRLRAGMSPDETGFGDEPEEFWGRLGGAGESQPVRTEAGAYKEFYGGVARAIRGDGVPPVTVDQVARGLDVIEAAFVSAREARVVTL